MALVVAGVGGWSSLLLWSSWAQGQRSGDIDSFESEAEAEAGVGVDGSSNKARMLWRWRRG